MIIGPAFNIDAYNYGVTGNEKHGIKSQKERGVLSMDQQYNAFNFVYYVLRSNNSYERKVSFLIIILYIYIYIYDTYLIILLLIYLFDYIIIRF